MFSEELRNEILERVYHRGGRYVAMDKTGKIYAYEKKPELDDNGDWLDVSGFDGVVIELTYFDDLFPDLQMHVKQLIDINEELNLINWELIPIDTPVLVSNNREKWIKGHFSGYKKLKSSMKYYTFPNGQTSWSAEKNVDCMWGYCKLADMGEVK